MAWVVIVPAWVWGLVALVSFSDADCGLIEGVLLFLGGPALALVWVMASLCAPTLFTNRRVRWSWCSVPLVGITGVGLAFAGSQAMSPRIRLCESALRDYAEEVRRNPEAHGGFYSRRVGLFAVKNTFVLGNDVYLVTGGWLDRVGIAHRPGRAISPRGWDVETGIQHEHLFGSWWWFREDF